jgi:hypothetical protein
MDSNDQQDQLKGEPNAPTQRLTNVPRPPHIKPIYFNPRVMSADEIAKALIEHVEQREPDQSAGKSEDS